MANVEEIKSMVEGESKMGAKEESFTKMMKMRMKTSQSSDAIIIKVLVTLLISVDTP